MALRTAVLRHIGAPVGTLASAGTKSTQDILCNFLRPFSSLDSSLTPIFQKVDLAQEDGQKDTPPNASSTKICIAIRSFDNRYPEDVMALPPNTRKVRLPTSRSLYTVLRSPHIDKKSREQFDMQIRRKLLTIKTRSNEISRRFFWLKRQRLFGAQFEVRFFTKTRLDQAKLQSLLQGSV